MGIVVYSAVVPGLSMVVNSSGWSIYGCEQLCLVSLWLCTMCLLSVSVMLSVFISSDKSKGTITRQQIPRPILQVTLYLLMLLDITQ